MKNKWMRMAIMIGFLWLTIKCPVRAQEVVRIPGGTLWRLDRLLENSANVAAVTVTWQPENVVLWFDNAVLPAYQTVSGEDADQVYVFCSRDQDIGITVLQKNPNILGDKLKIYAINPNFSVGNG